MPQFSVIIPVYNTAKYLRRCLDSILCQTMRDWECICVDDGSTDHSQAILREYANRDGRFRIFCQNNLGVSSARNFALNQARGNFITFVDSDDLLFADALEFWLGQMTEGIDILVDDIKFLFDNEHPILPGILSPTAGNQLEIREFADSFAPAKYYLPERRDASAWGKCYRRSVLTAEHRFPTDITFGEDQMFFADFLLEKHKWKLLKSCHYAYRIHPEQSIAFMTPEKIFCEIAMTAHLMSIMTKLDFSHDDMRRLWTLHNNVVCRAERILACFARINLHQRQRFAIDLKTITESLEFFPYDRFVYAAVYSLHGHCAWLCGFAQRVYYAIRRRLGR